MSDFGAVRSHFGLGRYRYKNAQEFWDDCQKRFKAWTREHYHNQNKPQIYIVRKDLGKYPTVHWKCRICKAEFFEQVPKKEIDIDRREFFK